MNIARLTTLRPHTTGLFILVFAAFSAFVRLGLALLNGDWALLTPGKLLPVLLIGLVFDVVVAGWWALPIAVISWLWPARRTPRGFPLAISSALGLAIATMVFVSVAEFVFWHEFASRFNFIAVDYLVYSREVLGNIRESYSMPALLGAVLMVSLLLWSVLFRRVMLVAARPRPPFGTRTLAFVSYLSVAAVGTAILQTSWKELLPHPQLAQLAGNGAWEFFHAYRYNEIDFQRFYSVLPDAEVDALTQAEFAGRAGYRLTGSPDMPIERSVIASGPKRKFNVVMVSVESLGAEFVAALGGKPGLTPNLDQLAREGMFFRNLYATGTRTVRGLEALTLSVPPTPGHAIPMRPNNSGLFTFGGVLKSQGYEPLYIYGGYSYFDNMKTFFGGNGYTVIDRSDIPQQDISFENIWGVADEDLYRLTVREIDTRYARGQRVFAHVMTTSNHRPFTYPTGRIDIPSGTGRDGAIKYSDYAIGQFVAEARSKPWFNDTLFVFVGDHTSIGRGYADLATKRYHIPMVIYAPSWIKPEIINTAASQIDVAPSLLGLLNIEYVSQFFGRDIFRDGASDPHIFLANYQTIGFINNGITLELKPRQHDRMFVQDTSQIIDGHDAEQTRRKGIALYQLAARRFSLHSRGKERPPT